MELRTPTEDDWEAICDADGRAFGQVQTPEYRAANRPMVDLSRFRIVCDGTEIVGIAGSYALDVALPGGAAAPMGGTTWVSVASTHRRQGALTRMMTAIHDDMEARGEVVASLYASQSGIYERYGYGVATQRRSIELRPAGLQLHERWRDRDTGPVRVLTGDAAEAHISTLWDRWWRLRAGEVERSPAHRALLSSRRTAPEGKAKVVLAHADGYAVREVTANWNEGYPAHELRIHELVACTPDAHAALWRTLIGTDLVGRIVSRILPSDDTVPLLLADPRAYATTHVADGVWAHVLDIPTAFGARTYTTTDSLVLEVDGRRWRIDGSPDGAEVKVVRSRPDLVLTRSCLGPLLYGGVRPSWLARGGRIEAADRVLGRADAFFTTPMAPHCQTAY